LAFVSRSRYVIDLSGVPPSRLGDDVRAISLDDAEALAHLMLEAYRGTIDYEGEDIDDARAEISSFFDGDPMLEHSWAAVVDRALASAVLVSMFEDAPFISYVMTHPEFKNQGWGGRVVAATLAALADAGHHEVALYITDGNLPSEALFRSLGALRVME
jgi:RimJ/RimL family protein N-acetyltransferase